VTLCHFERSEKSLTYSLITLSTLCDPSSDWEIPRGEPHWRHARDDSFPENDPIFSWQPTPLPYYFKTYDEN